VRRARDSSALASAAHMVGMFDMTVSKELIIVRTGVAAKTSAKTSATTVAHGSQLYRMAVFATEFKIDFFRKPL
jgi:hypothetical protein